MRIEFRSQKSEVRIVSLLVCALFAVLFSGCVTKAEAKRQAQIAFLQGQQQGMMRAQQLQSHGPNISFVGPVQNSIVAWRNGLTLAQAIVSANYLSDKDPSAIIVHRNGQDIPVDPKGLLNGEDFPLQVGDVVEVQP
jgi:hypothetical protein